MLSKKRTWHCQHCNEDLSYCVYKRHKEQYFDHDKQIWITHVERLYDSEEDDNDSLVVLQENADTGMPILAMCINAKHVVGANCT